MLGLKCTIYKIIKTCSIILYYNSLKNGREQVSLLALLAIPKQIINTNEILVIKPVNKNRVFENKEQWFDSHATTGGIVVR